MARLRDPAEPVLQGTALAVTAGLALFLAIVRFTPALPHGGRSIVNQVQLSVVAPPREQPAPQPKPQARIARVARPQRMMRVARSEPMPVAAQRTEETTHDPVPVAEAPAPTPTGSDYADPDAAYEAQLLAIVQSRTWHQTRQNTAFCVPPVKARSALNLGVQAGCSTRASCMVPALPSSTGRPMGSSPRATFRRCRPTRSGERPRTSFTSQSPSGRVAAVPSENTKARTP